ncbi:hypothetical protein CEXT_732931 [Caerostris extrusa]|uniref:Uncharacterized protein n=1 Tax=Caerostris extrusa TaxID=172846 RepID=A0AAV4R2A1_CAEEX|nr:hypothetical protein CEXT_732931 [Caerostris extrusa]
MMIDVMRNLKYFIVMSSFKDDDGILNWLTVDSRYDKLDDDKQRSQLKIGESNCLPLLVTEGPVSQTCLEEQKKLSRSYMFGLMDITSRH